MDGTADVRLLGLPAVPLTGRVLGFSGSFSDVADQSVPFAELHRVEVADGEAVVELHESGAVEELEGGAPRPY